MKQKKMKLKMSQQHLKLNSLNENLYFFIIIIIKIILLKFSKFILQLKFQNKIECQKNKTLTKFLKNR